MDLYLSLIFGFIALSQICDKSSLEYFLTTMNGESSYSQTISFPLKAVEASTIVPSGMLSPGDTRTKYTIDPFGINGAIAFPFTR